MQIKIKLSWKQIRYILRWLITWFLQSNYSGVFSIASNSNLYFFTFHERKYNLISNTFILNFYFINQQTIQILFISLFYNNYCSFIYKKICSCIYKWVLIIHLLSIYCMMIQKFLSKIIFSINDSINDLNMIWIWGMNMIYHYGVSCSSNCQYIKTLVDYLSIPCIECKVNWLVNGNTLGLNVKLDNAWRIPYIVHSDKIGLLIILKEGLLE